MSSTGAPRIPIGIRELIIENFRGVRSLELKFLDAKENASDIVVLAGPNASGKTSVLEACLLVLGHPELIRNVTKSPIVHAGAPSFRITGWVQTGGDKAEVTLLGDAVPQRSLRHLRASRELPCLYFSSWRAPRLVGAIPVTAGRRGVRPFNTEEDRISLVKQFLINAKAHSFMATSGQSPGTSLFESTIRQLNEIWQTFHPGRDQFFSVDPVSDDPDAGFDVFLVGPSRTRVPLDSLSSGQLELVAFFGAFLRQKFNEGVIIIDEPELHLDPQWHTMMLRAIRQFLPHVQIIVATHSPEVFDSVYSFQRHLLLPPGDPRNVTWKARPSEVAG
jgi:energy-coupling factor transporter ATP-binding protein EcfA2